METLFPRRNNPFQRFGERYGHYFGDNEFLGRSPLGDHISIAPHTAANISKSGKAYEIEVVERSFKLPDNVDADAIGARYENGILYLRLPYKQVTTANKQIAIE